MTSHTVYIIKQYLAGAFIMLAAFFNAVQQADAVGINVPPEERAALVALFNATSGNGWTNHTNWDSGDPCLNSWYGITCSAGHVTEIRLTNNKLIGDLPPLISDLSQLTVFEASGNVFFGGTLKPFIHLSQLQILQLDIDNFKGPIPPEFANLNQLFYLNLSNNSLSGTILKQLGNISQLTHLWLGGNSFTGPIPEQLGNLSQLTLLKLNDNQLCGLVPVALSNLTNLKDGDGLNLNNNNLITDVQPPLFNVFLINKSNSFSPWQTTQNSKTCFPWPQFLPAITGTKAN